MSKKIKNAVWILTDSQHHKAASDGRIECRN